MIFNGGAHFGQKCIGEGRNDADTFVQYDLFNAMNGKEDRVRLDAGFFSICNMVHPILERIEIDSTDCYPVGGDIQQTTEESFSWTVKTHYYDGIQLHR